MFLVYLGIYFEMSVFLCWSPAACVCVFDRLNQASFHSHSSGDVCNVTWEKYVLIGDYSSSAQFYVTFAVFVFLYCMAALVLYVGYTSLYRESRKLPMIVSDRVCSVGAKESSPQSSSLVQFHSLFILKRVG